MKTLNLSLPYRKKPDEDKMFPKQFMVTEWVLRILVAKRYPTGLNRTDSRIWGRIMDLLDDTEDGKIHLEQSEIVWIREVLNWCLDNSAVPAPASSWVNLLDEYIQTKAKESEQPELKSAK